MSKHIRSWQQPKDIFVGVPYLYDSDNHPYRYEASWPFVAGYPRRESISHNLLPENYRLSPLSGNEGYYLIGPDNTPVGIYVRKEEGFLLRLSDSERKKKPHCPAIGRPERLGSLFLAACIDERENDPAWRGRVVGTYSMAGLHAAMRAHDVLVDYAEKYHNKPIDPDVQAARGWQPQKIQAVPVTGQFLSDLSSMRLTVTRDEESVILAFLAGQRALNPERSLVAITDDEKNTLAYAFKVGNDLYHGFDLTTEAEVKESVAKEKNLSAEFLKTKRVNLLDLKYPLEPVGKGGHDRMTFTMILEDVVISLGLSLAASSSTPPPGKPPAI